MPAGKYWIAVTFDATAYIGYKSDAANSIAFRTFTHGAPPDPFGTSTLQTGQALNLYLRGFQ